MSQTEYSADSFYKGLVEHGLIVPTRVPGTFGRNAVFEDVLARFDGLIGQLAKNDGAELYVFPPAIDRTIIEKTGYLDSFPNLAGTVFSFFGNEREAKGITAKVGAGEPWADTQGMTEVCLNPAACYPIYPTMTGSLPEKGRLITMFQWVFRHEPSMEPTRMQNFRVREFVRAGNPDDVVAWRDMWLKRGTELLESLGLPAKADVAADPFFGRSGKMLANNQIDQKLKFEVLIPVVSKEKPTACCSFNYHMEKFGEIYGIKNADGSVAHTACLGFGLERCVMALFKTHGFVPSEWPEAVRKRMWP